LNIVIQTKKDFQRLFWIIFVDLKAAFDLVVCMALLKLCSGYGVVPQWAESMYTDAHLPFLYHWTRRWIYHWVCDAWPVRRQTYGYLPSHRAPPPIGRYQFMPLGEQRYMYVNNLPRVVT